MITPLNLTLKKNLEWLAENWERKHFSSLSSYNTEFYAALRNILDGTERRADVILVIEGTSGKVADSYAHMLDVAPHEFASDPWVSLRRLGDISECLGKMLASGCPD